MRHASTILSSMVSEQKLLLNFFVFIGFPMFFLNCAAQYEGTWKSNVLYQQDNLGKDRLASGRSIFLLPLIVNEKFDTSSAIMPAAQMDMIKNRDRKMVTCSMAGLDSLYRKEYKKEMDSSFYKSILLGELLKTTANDSVWAVFPCRYLLTVRLISGMTIKTFEQKEKKKVRLEGEMWDSKNPGVVWRSEVYGFEIDAGRSDGDFIASGIKSLFSTLPSFLPVFNEENW